MTKRISLETGAAALKRFRLEMLTLGYMVRPYPLYDHLENLIGAMPAHLTDSEQARWLKDDLSQTYSRTALFVRTAPDFIVCNPHVGGQGRYWLAEVKQESEDYPNLACEACQLLCNYNTAVWTGVDIRYVYVPKGINSMRWQSAPSVARGGRRVLHEWPGHASNDFAEELLLNLGWMWPRQTSNANYDPFTVIEQSELQRWNAMDPAREEVLDVG